MNVPNIDNRKKEDIINYIKEVSKFYTPEWRFDEKNPDVGSSLALLYAEMFEETINRLNQVPYKNYISFINMLDLKLLPVVPAQGIVTFNLNPGINEGVFIKKNTQLLADIPEQTERKVFETQSEVFVTPARIKDIYCVSSIKDSIICVFEEQPEGKSENCGIRFFDFDSGKNLQKHGFYLCHKDVLRVEGEASVELYLNVRHKKERSQAIMENLADPGCVRWFYRSKGGWTSFDDVQLIDNKLVLKKSGHDSIEPVEFSGQTSCWIGCEAKDIHRASQMEVLDVFIKSENSGIQPERVFSQDMEQDLRGFYPFGDKFSIYNECYIACAEALSKKASRIEFSFDLGFKKIDIDEVLPQREVEWKMIMKKTALKEPEKYDITTDGVVWEYWNGAGWTRLFIDDKYDTVFGKDNKGRKIISFMCPEDMEPVWVNAHYTFWIRVRLISIGNIYKTSGYYISPWLENLSFSYRYQDLGLAPEKMLVLDSTRLDDVSEMVRPDKKAVSIFNPYEEGEPAVYLGFDTCPYGAPISMFFNLLNKGRASMPVLKWEYFSPVNGQNHWKALKVADRTEDFSQSGIVAFSGPADFKPGTLFGKQRYWIRIVNVDKGYDGSDCNVKPCFEGIYRIQQRLSTLKLCRKKCFLLVSRKQIRSVSFQIKMSRSMRFG